MSKSDKIKDENINETIEETEDLSEVERLTAELEQVKDLLMRTAAEFDNYKKRTQREAERIGADARAAFAKQLLPIVDNLERAAENDTADVADYKKGVDMTTKQFFEILKNMGLEEIEALNLPFDPNFHYAVSQVEKEGAEPDTVAEVFQKGYKMADTVIRPAMVVVVKS